jgi:hypothetical protein
MSSLGFRPAGYKPAIQQIENLRYGRTSISMAFEGKVLVAERKSEG